MFFFILKKNLIMHDIGVAVCLCIYILSSSSEIIQRVSLIIDFTFLMQFLNFDRFPKLHDPSSHQQKTLLHIRNLARLTMFFYRLIKEELFLSVKYVSSIFVYRSLLFHLPHFSSVTLGILVDFQTCLHLVMQIDILSILDLLCLWKLQLEDVPFPVKRRRLIVIVFR